MIVKIWEKNNYGDVGLDFFKIYYFEILYRKVICKIECQISVFCQLCMGFGDQYCYVVRLSEWWILLNMVLKLFFICV